MISKSDKRKIREISRKYHAKRVLLFGSSLDVTRDSQDIDIAVEGISPEDFFEYYGELMLKLSKPIDVIDLSGSSKFTKLIQHEGVMLYG
jgi:predicted nucleotidyltransferase